MAGPKSPKHAPASKPKPTTTPAAGPTTAAPPSTAPPSASAPASASASSLPSTAALRTLWTAYVDATPSRLKLVDAFLVFLALSGAAQFAYCVLVTNFPYNAFLAGFGSTIGQFVLTASLRSQVNVTNRGLFKDVSPERAFADFVVGSVVLHFFVFNFLG